MQEKAGLPSGLLSAERLESGNGKEGLQNKRLCFPDTYCIIKVLVVECRLLLAELNTTSIKPHLTLRHQGKAWFFFKKMAFIVYKHTTPSGKVYIGMTGRSTKERWRNGKGYKSQPRFFRAIEKYGWENIQHEVIYICDDAENAFRKEQELILIYDSTNPDKGYNNSIGGAGGSLGATLDYAARANISRGHVGLKHSEETKQKLSKMRQGELNPNYGKHMSEEAKEKQRISAKRTYSTDEYKKRASAIQKEIGSRPEVRKKRSDAAKGEKNHFYGIHMYGADNPNYGKKLSEKAKQRLKECKSKPIVCLETETVYNSAKDAERFYGVAHGSIYKVLDNPNRTSCGYHWERVNNNE